MACFKFIVLTLFLAKYANAFRNFVSTWSDAAVGLVYDNGGDALRTSAFTHLAIYRTLNSDRQMKFEGSNVEVAANFAAHHILSSLHPALKSSLLDGVLATQLSSYNDSNLRNSKRLGEYHALEILTTRASDGFADYVAYTPTSKDGVYKFVANQTYVKGANAGGIATIVDGVKPTSSKYFKGGPSTFGSTNFTTQLNEVRTIGFLNSTTRTSNQSLAARFYEEIPNHSLYAQWYLLCHWYLSRQFVTMDVYKTSRIFTLLAMSQYETYIAVHYQKYKYNSWRPITAIRKTIPTWLPYLKTPFTPEYPSEHAAVAAASAYAIAIPAGLKLTSPVLNLGIPSVPDNLPLRPTRNLLEVVEEESNSRIYGGMNFRKAVVDGKAIGYDIARDVLKYFI